MVFSTIPFVSSLPVGWVGCKLCFLSW
jgi:hypothetical protein